jgi:hypothetical protein
MQGAEGDAAFDRLRAALAEAVPSSPTDDPGSGVQ